MTAMYRYLHTPRLNRSRAAAGFRMVVALAVLVSAVLTVDTHVTGATQPPISGELTHATSQGRLDSYHSISGIFARVWQVD